ncbi:protein CONSERVED IN THE GREEN LINEAGE AND DIATOMS 27, chloroplastic isoform X2 [Phoenix dactylifera]|uniref:Protein CONSERVED IN THE GREEN LINEAGE AND DIATOMS 27, chloroplastic isoform X2 n=1 Tax=Phoenix dactylifera TaxID=42345 RepID=A0A8B9A3H9_PHODC|nr:protein CONSERVED IN THE GREEN LINEAGE AND DIATOMS 27, chloroplastic isoform X2 [Phoenix dactylifera]
MASSLASSVFLCPLAIPKFPSPSPNPNANPNPRRRRKTSGSQSHFSPISACSASSFRNGSPPETECPVPLEQQPVNEYQALSTSFPFSWAAADLRDYCSRLALTGVSFALFVGLPVAAFGTRAVADPEVDGLLSALGTVFTGLLAVTLAVVRMYLGWAYVGNRLLSATVEYEETGWYDGQVKPVLSRVKLTLLGLAVSLVVCVLLFINIENSRNPSEDVGERAVAGVYNDASARSFEPDAFCGEPDLS